MEFIQFALMSGDPNSPSILGVSTLPRPKNYSYETLLNTEGLWVCIIKPLVILEKKDGV